MLEKGKYMQFRIVALLCLSLLLGALALPALAQAAPTVSISPPAGEVEKAIFSIEISGLAARANYTVEIVFAGEVVFQSDETSDAAGHIAYPISSTAGDAPGIYTVQVRQGGAVIASANFELTAAAMHASAEASQPQVTVSPATAPFGSVQTVRIAALLPEADYTVEITASETAQTVYRRQHNSGSAGRIEIEIFAVEGATPGPHSITVYDSAGALAADGAFTIEAPAARAVRAQVQPNSIEAGASALIAVSGLNGFAGVTAQITNAAAVLIDTVSARASSDGSATLSFASPPNLADGLYTVDIFVDGEKRASADLSIGDSLAPATAQVAVEPPSAPSGSEYVISISGLAAEQAFRLILLDPAGAQEYSRQRLADAAGRFNLTISSTAEDAVGRYRAEIYSADGADLLAATDFEVTAAAAAVRASVTDSPSPASDQPTVALGSVAEASASASAPGAVEVFEGRLQAGRAQIAFQGRAGQYALIRVSSTDFDPAASLKDSAGQELAFNDDSRGQKDALIGPLLLPDSGTYQLEVRGAPLMMAQGAETGEFRATIESPRINDIAFDQPVNFSLAASAPALYFALPVAAGDSLTVTLDSGLDTLLQVVAPNGSEYAFDDDGGAGFAAELKNLAFAEAGTYILALAAFDENASGTGRLTVARNPARLLAEDELIVTLNDKTIRELVVFDAVADELLILNLHKRYGDVADLFVTATVDGMEVMSYSTMGVPEHLPLAFVMPMGGRVLVELEKYGFDDGIALAVALERPQP